MFVERVALTTVATGTTAAAGTVVPFAQYGWIGALMPMVISVIMVVIVRSIIDMQATKKRGWNYNVLVIALCSIFSAVFVHEYALSAGAACMLGMGVGATGVGIISFGKPVLLAVVAKLQEGLKAVPSDTIPPASE